MMPASHPVPFGDVAVPLPTAPWSPQTGARHSVALEILLHGPLSRSELARRLDLSPASLTRLTKPLLDSGLIVEASNHVEPRSGRPTRPLEVVASSHHFVGIKLTGDDAHAVATSLRAEVLARKTVRLPSRHPDAVVALVADLVGTVARDVPRVSGLGVCLGGLATERGVVAHAPFLDWTEPVPLAAMLERAIGLPTVVGNDVMALTRAEHWFGAARGCRHFALVTVGAGVGCGLVVHDEIVESTDAGLGLVGHHPLDPFGPLCDMGHHGCAAAMLTIGSIEARASVALQRSVSYEECLDLATRGDIAATRVISESGRALGRLIAAVANIALARKIILSGEGMRLAVVARDAVAEGIRLDRHPFAEPLETEVHLTDFDEWARGAAATAIQNFVTGGF
jgi:predicted NBD/HSP70 family sugar kinase